MSISIRDGLSQLAELITTAGVPCVLDAADLDLPGAVLYPNLIDFDTLGAGFGDGEGFGLTADLILIAGDSAHALDHLDPMLAKVRAALPVGEARAVTYTLVSQSPDPLPALQLSITVQITEE